MKEFLTNKKYIYIVVLVLVILLVGGGITYFALSNKDNKVNNDSNINNGANNTENNDPNGSGEDLNPGNSGGEVDINNQGGEGNIDSESILNSIPEYKDKGERVTLANTKVSDDKIVQEFKVKLNNNNVNLNIDYTFEEGFIVGKYNNHNFASYLYDTSDVDAKDKFTKENINSLLDKTSFKVIDGIDKKEYLLVYAKGYIESNDVKKADSLYMYIINDKGEILDDTGLEVLGLYNFPCEFEDKKAYSFDNTFNVDLKNNDSYQIRIKVDGNKIFNYSLVYTDEEMTNAIMEERVYTINNNKIEYYLLNTYKVLKICNKS